MWAFGTSIAGLGLPPERFWSLTLADYLALKLIHDRKLEREFRLWAVERVEFRNAHRLFGDIDLPWQVEDLLGTGDRAARGEKLKAEKIEQGLNLMKLQRGLGAITNDAPADLLPSWGKRQWDPKDYPELFGGKH